MATTNNKVTLKDIYEVSNRLEDKMDKGFNKIAAGVEENAERITAIEYWKANLVGKLTAVLAILSFGITIVKDWVQEKLFGK